MRRTIRGWRAFEIAAIAGLVCLLLAVSAFAPADAAEEPLKVGFVYVGPVGDFGWTYTHDQGRLHLKEQLGDRVETTYVEAVPEGPDSRSVFTQLAQTDHDLIFGTAFGYMDFMLETAEMFPDRAFMHASGHKMGPNMGNYFIRVYQGDYLAGVIAGHETESDVIGYVAPHPIPQMARLISAYALGARSVNPDVEVRVVWTNTWYDPGTEREAAMSLIDLGADVIGHHQDSPAVPQAAQERGVLSFGKAADMHDHAPEAVLASTVYNWGPFYVQQAEQVLDGTWEPTSWWGGVEEGAVDFVHLSDKIDSEARQDVERIMEQMNDGEFQVFEGPIRDNTGERRVPEGEVYDGDDLWFMDWYVEGVVGEFPGE